jgi:hypothetical protein
VKIHCIEGLGCYYLRPLTKAVKSLNLNVEVVTYPWTVKPLDVQYTEEDIVCGHSYGGDKALKLRSWIQKEPKALFFLDPRKPLSTKPEWYVSGKAYCYYQTVSVKGYEVEGAENMLIKGFNHFRMPQNPKFLFKLMEIVKSNYAFKKTR